ncbi:MAG: TrbC/VirB2 family protein [Candidatus Paceibacterota bacterium]
MKFFKNNWYKLALLLHAFLIPVISLAQVTGGPPVSPPSTGGKLVNPINIDSIPGLIQTILEGLLKIGIPIVALAIVYCGFLFVFARGNSEKLSKAKEALLYTLIGAAILLGSWAIAKMISATVLAL